jgi:membrane protease subunit HflK
MARFDGNGTPEIKVVMAQYRDALRRKLRWLGPVVVVAIVGLLGLGGFYEVAPGEVGVVRTFGRESSRKDPGLHFKLPLVQQVDVVNTEKIRRTEIGFRGDKRQDDEALMITGDENIVEAQMIVQYRIADPSKTLFRLRDAEKVLHDAGEVALRGVVGRTTIDEVLTTGREAAQTETRKHLQELMDQCSSGLVVTEVKLQAVDAPDEVKDAFHDVVRAREEKEQKINTAKGYAADKIPKARGEAQKVLRAAEAYKTARIERAAGDAAKFQAVLAEYLKAKDVTRRRLHLETLEAILGRLHKKVIVDGALGQNLLPLLPLGGLLGSGAAAAAPAAEGGR